MSGTVSAIIPTKGRPSDLEAVVESVLGQSILPSQVIIVNQSPIDDGWRRVERLYADACWSVRQKVQLCHIGDATIPGLAAARNRAMEIARGDIWLFLDDDVVLERSFLEELVTVYQKHPEVSGVSGIICNYQTPSWAHRLWASVFVGGPFHDERQPIYWKADRLRNAEPIAVCKLGGGLMSFRAKAIGGHRFDENLHGVSDGEDVDFCVRLGPNAILTIAPRARLVHNSSPVGRDMGHWLRRDVRANYYLYWKNWSQSARNRLCFTWLNLGYLLVVSLAAMRRFSLNPWHAFWNGISDARAACHPWKAANHKAMARRARVGWRF
jgi:GT2 family glycosyltransferase